MWSDLPGSAKVTFGTGVQPGDVDGWAVYAAGIVWSAHVGGPSLRRRRHRRRVADPVRRWHVVVGGPHVRHRLGAQRDVRLRPRSHRAGAARPAGRARLRRRTCRADGPARGALRRGRTRRADGHRPVAADDRGRPGHMGGRRAHAPRDQHPGAPLAGRRRVRRPPHRVRAGRRRAGRHVARRGDPRRHDRADRRDAQGAHPARADRDRARTRCGQRDQPPCLDAARHDLHGVARVAARRLPGQLPRARRRGRGRARGRRARRPDDRRRFRRQRDRPGPARPRGGRTRAGRGSVCRRSSGASRRRSSYEPPTAPTSSAETGCEHSSGRMLADPILDM